MERPIAINAKWYGQDKCDCPLLILKSQEVLNNHGCDPTHQFCAMTPK
jgi:hypothetical protein